MPNVCWCKRDMCRVDKLLFILARITGGYIYVELQEYFLAGLARVCQPSLSNGATVGMRPTPRRATQCRLYWLSITLHTVDSVQWYPQRGIC